jgi:hypothetical protein
MKSYVHVPKEVIDAQLTRTRLINNDVIIFDDDGKKINKSCLKRSHDLIGAGIDYLCDFTEYICTHKKQFIKPLDDDPDFDLIRADFETYKDIASGGISGQRYRITNEALRYYAHPKSVYIPLPNGNFRLSYPFIITFEKADREKLTPDMIQRLENIGAEKTGVINIRFSKWLFKSFLEGKSQWRQMPSGIYAKLYDMQHREEEKRQTFIQTIDKNRDRLSLFGLTDEEIDKEKQAENVHRTRLDDGRYIAAIKTFFYAVTDKYDERRNYISLPLIELLEKTNKDLLTVKAGRRIPRNNHHAGIFIQSAIDKMKLFGEFDFEITRFDQDPLKPGNIWFHITRRRRK